MGKVILYSSNCPKCKQLEKMLNIAGIEYEICTDIDCMLALGMRDAPNLQVGGKILNFAEAWKWIKEQEVNK